MSKHDTCQLDVATQPLQHADCSTALILNSVSGVKAYCHFKLLIQSVPSPPHIDYLLHGHYLLTNIPGLSVICKNSSISDVRVIQGCSSCLYNFPCPCTIRTSNLTLYTGFHGCAYKRSSKVHLVGFTVNLGFFQHVNMSLAKLIDPSRLFAESKTEHFGRLLGVGTNFVSRQAEIFKHPQENSIELGTYVKQLTMSQKEFDEQRERLHQSTKNIILPKEVTRTYTGLTWAALLFCYLSFVYQLLLLVVVSDTFSEKTLLTVNSYNTRSTTTFLTIMFLHLV